MAEEQQEQDRNEPATPFKLREARRRGQVNKSLEVNSFLILATMLAITYFMGEDFIAHQLDVSRSVFSQAHMVELTIPNAVTWFSVLTSAMFGIYWPFVGGIILIGILSNMFQTGPVFSFFPLKPDSQRINPVKGFKRLFSTRLLYESLKTILKLFLFGGVIYLVIHALTPTLVALVDVDPNSYAMFLLENARDLIFVLLLVLFIVAAFDIAYTRWDFAKKMRMSRREIKEEVKRREGDPQVRAKLRELQREAAKRAGSLQKVPDADVLITNPTHLAIALRYDRESMQAPEVCAKGAGELALKMRVVAAQNGVPVVENKPLARKLFQRATLDDVIPEDLYPKVAKILVWVFSLRQSNKRFGVSK